MKLRRPWLELNEQQQLFLAVVLVILLAISILYCLGLASLAARQAWGYAPAPGTDSQIPAEEIEATARPLPEAITATLTTP